MARWAHLLAVAFGLFAVNVGLAQVPAGSTGQCKDGTYTTASSRKGACRGHKGVQAWFAAEPAAPVASPAVTPMAPKTATSAAAPLTPIAPMKPLAARGLGLVWVNTVSNIYHCPGTKFYGKTKEGKYISEANAKAQGARPDHNHPCRP